MASKRRLRRTLRGVMEVLTAVAGVCGILVLLAALAPLAGLHLVSLATGSMSPGFPAGSVLLVRDSLAQEVDIDQIVTVLRADGQAVTHRVVENTAAGEGARLVLKGDANQHEDPSPYLVTRVGVVLGGIPFGAGFLGLAQQPAAVPVLALAASLLVAWAWWPAPRMPARRLEEVSGESP